MSADEQPESSKGFIASFLKKRRYSRDLVRAFRQSDTKKLKDLTVIIKAEVPKDPTVEQLREAAKKALDLYKDAMQQGSLVAFDHATRALISETNSHQLHHPFSAELPCELQLERILNSGLVPDLDHRCRRSLEPYLLTCPPVIHLEDPNTSVELALAQYEAAVTYGHILMFKEEVQRRIDVYLKTHSPTMIIKSLNQKVQAVQLKLALAQGIVPTTDILKSLKAGTLSKFNQNSGDRKGLVVHGRNLSQVTKTLEHLIALGYPYKLDGAARKILYAPYKDYGYKLDRYYRLDPEQRNITLYFPKDRFFSKKYQKEAVLKVQSLLNSSLLPHFPQNNLFLTELEFVKFYQKNKKDFKLITVNGQLCYLQWQWCARLGFVVTLTDDAREGLKNYLEKVKLIKYKDAAQEAIEGLKHGSIVVHYEIFLSEDEAYSYIKDLMANGIPPNYLEIILDYSVSKNKNKLLRQAKALRELGLKINLINIELDSISKEDAKKLYRDFQSFESTRKDNPMPYTIIPDQEKQSQGLEEMPPLPKKLLVVDHLGPFIPEHGLLIGKPSSIPKTLTDDWRKQTLKMIIEELSSQRVPTVELRALPRLTQEKKEIELVLPEVFNQAVIYLSYFQKEYKNKFYETLENETMGSLVETYSKILPDPYVTVSGKLNAAAKAAIFSEFQKRVIDSGALSLIEQAGEYLHYALLIALQVGLNPSLNAQQKALLQYYHRDVTTRVLAVDFSQAIEALLKECRFDVEKGK